MAETYYDIIGVPRSATAERIKGAYRERAKRIHPDRFESADELAKQRANEEFKELQEAYSVLSHPDRRALYDAELDRFFQRPPAASAPSPTPPQRKPAWTPAPSAYSAPAHASTTWGARLVYFLTFIVVRLLMTGGGASSYTNNTPPAPNLGGGADVVSTYQAPAVAPPPARRASSANSVARVATNPAVQVPHSAPNAADAPFIPTGKLFTVGSSEAEVFAIQGSPSAFSSVAGSAPTVTWRYGDSWVEFQQGRVILWHSTPQNPLGARTTNLGNAP